MAQDGAVAPTFTTMTWPAVPTPSVVRLVAPLAYNRSPAVYEAKPVPPLSTSSVPPKVTAPEVAVLGVRPVLPAENDVTPPPGAEPLLAAVMRPVSSTVMEARVYEPAVTPDAGKSAVAKERNVGAAFAPVAGPANTRFLAWFAQDAVKVPVVVTGELVTVNVPGMLRPTEVTVPPVIATATQVKLVPSH